VVLTVSDTARLSEIDASTLILWGERDAVLPREEQERTAVAIPGATLKSPHTLVNKGKKKRKGRSALVLGPAL
jgi:pimeloyl-ACP methyl ester carboxylesterase